MSADVSTLARKAIKATEEELKEALEKEAEQEAKEEQKRLHEEERKKEKRQKEEQMKKQEEASRRSSNGNFDAVYQWSSTAAHDSARSHGRVRH